MNDCIMNEYDSFVHLLKLQIDVLCLIIMSFFFCFSAPIFESFTSRLLA